MPTLHLSNLDARLAYLAVQYHLERPGSEIDRGNDAGPFALAGVGARIEQQLDKAVVEVELGPEQSRRLDEALAGTINELKSGAILAAGGRSMVPRFHEGVRRLFPEVSGDEEEAVRLARHALDLRRRLESAVQPAPPGAAQPARARWQFWRR